MRGLVLSLALLIAAAGCRRADEPAPAAPADTPGAADPTDSADEPDCGEGCRPAPYTPAPPAPGAEPVNSPGRLDGGYRVGSRVKDRDALGGFAGSGNYPLALGDGAWGTAGAVALVASPDEPVARGASRGFLVRLVNRTRGGVEFEATDSCLSLVQEARDPAGRWRAIERLPRTFCGNSYHRVFLGPGQYWRFPARAYTGAFATALRLRLDRGDRPALYSNEFAGAVDLGQFDREADEDCATGRPVLVPADRSRRPAALDGAGP